MDDSDQVISVCCLLSDEINIYRKRQLEAVLLYASFCFGVAMAILEGIVRLGLITASLLVVLMGVTALIASQVIRLSRDRGKHCVHLRQRQLKDRLGVDLDPYRNDDNDHPSSDSIHPPLWRDLLKTLRRYWQTSMAKLGMTDYYEMLVFLLMVVVCLAILHGQYSHTSMGP